MPSLQFLVRQSEFIRALFCVQIALRNLTAIIQESSAKFFAAISGCNYRNDLKLTHREFFPAQSGRRWVRSLQWVRLQSLCIQSYSCNNKSTDSFPQRFSFFFFMLCSFATLHTQCLHCSVIDHHTYSLLSVES